jgi:hypothetical protein
VHLQLERLLYVLEIAYKYGAKASELDAAPPLNINFGKGALIIKNSDFIDFLSVVEESTSIEMNIDKLVYSQN